jgi:hypothetical protein
MKKFNFRKSIKRNNFTAVFGGFGKRRLIMDYYPTPIRKPRQRRSLIQRIRRASQGFRNKIFGRLNALKMRLMFGRLKNTLQFRR